MKQKFLVTVLFSVLLMVSSAQATIIDVYDFKGTFDTSGIGNLQPYYWLKTGMDSPVPLGQFDFNKLSRIPSASLAPIWINMLQRTFAPEEVDKTGDGTIAEHWAMYTSNQQWGSIEWDGDIDFTTSSYSVSPIPDLSAYHINDLYVDSFITQNGSTVDYDIRILADAAPVPEPSTFFLLAIGVAGFGFLRKRIHK